MWVAWWNYLPEQLMISWEPTCRKFLPTGWNRMKPKCLVLLIFLGVCGPSLTVFSIDESKVKSYSVTRRTASGSISDHDVFTVKMKDGHYCPHEVWTWCNSLSASFHSSWPNRSSCSCTCNYATRCFLPSLRTCIDATSAHKFGGECVQNQLLFSLMVDFEE